MNELIDSEVSEAIAKISGGLMTTIVILSVYALIIFSIILADCIVFFSEKEKEDTSFVEFRKHKEYKVYHVLIAVFLIPAWIIEGVIILICLSIYKFLCLPIYKLFNFTLIKKG